MEIRASVRSHRATHQVAVSTDGRVRALDIPPKQGGAGSSVNGGELLALALATCYCNDIYREAAKRGLPVDGVEVEVTSEFGAAGEPARRITYTARVQSPATAEEVAALLRHTDTMAEVQNTLRAGIRVEFLGAGEAVAAV